VRQVLQTQRNKVLPNTAPARTPNGNDYGADLLKQHYAVFKHD
jgi:hypothetical protein